MKKTLALLLTVLLLALACCASAQTVSALPSEILRTLVAGKIFDGTVSGYGFNGETYNLNVTLYERVHVAAADLESLQAGDEMNLMLEFVTVKTVEKDEFGYTVTDEWNNVLNFYPDDDGSYYCVNDTEHTLMRPVIQFDCVLAKDFQFVDASDPDLDAEPVTGTVEDVVRGYEEGSYFTEENTILTFDENGALLTVMRVYTPWN